MSSSSRISPSAKRHDTMDDHSFKKRRRLRQNIKLSSSSSSSCLSSSNSSSPSPSSSTSSCCVSENHICSLNPAQPCQNKYATRASEPASSMNSMHLHKEDSVKSRLALYRCSSDAESSIGSSTGSFSVLHSYHSKNNNNDCEVQSRFDGVSIPSRARDYSHTFPHEVCSGSSDQVPMKAGQEVKNVCSYPPQDEKEHQLYEVEERKKTDCNIDLNSGGLGFDPNTVFRTDFFCNSGDGHGDDLFTCASPDNTSWFLNELDSEGNAFLDEVLDQEWMASAIANLDRLNDTVDSCDSCVLHLLHEPWRHA